MFAMIMRTYEYLTNKKLTEIKDYKTADFKDMDKVSDYAKQAIDSAKVLGFANGTGDNKIEPKAYSNRASVVKLIIMLLEMNK